MLNVFYSHHLGPKVSLGRVKRGGIPFSKQQQQAATNRFKPQKAATEQYQKLHNSITVIYF